MAELLVDPSISELVDHIDQNEDTLLDHMYQQDQHRQAVEAELDDIKASLSQSEGVLENIQHDKQQIQIGMDIQLMKAKQMNSFISDVQSDVLDLKTEIRGLKKSQDQIEKTLTELNLQLAFLTMYPPNNGPDIPNMQSERAKTFSGEPRQRGFSFRRRAKSQSSLSSKTVTCMFYGDSMVGLTCLRDRYVFGTFSEEYMPSICDDCDKTIKFKQHEILLKTLHTTGGAEYDIERKSAYPQLDVIVLGYAVCSPSSYQFVKEKCYIQLRKNCPDVPIILVGTKIDERDDIEMTQRVGDMHIEALTTKQGKELANNIGAVKFFETSAKNNLGIDALFEAIIEEGLVYQKIKSQPEQSMFQKLKTKLKSKSSD